MRRQFVQEVYGKRFSGVSPYWVNKVYMYMNVCMGILDVLSIRGGVCVYVCRYVRNYYINLCENI